MSFHTYNAKHSHIVCRNAHFFVCMDIKAVSGYHG